MNKVRRFAWQVPFVAVALLGAAFSTLSLAGCGDDDDDGVSGRGGASGTSGKAGKAGSSTGGSGGTGGAPQAGSGGAPQAGSGGAPQAGSGGGGAGGAGGADAGQGGGGTGGAPQAFCATQTGLAFCADFDGTNPLETGGVGWDFLEDEAGSVVELTSGQVVSSPNAVRLAAAMSSPDRPSLMKTIQLNEGDSIVDAKLDFDVFLDTVPALQGAGLGLSDFQFVGNDSFGFRLVIETNAEGTPQLLRQESVGTGAPNDDLSVDLLPLKTWTHVRYEVSFSSGDNSELVQVRLYLGSGGTPALQKEYASPFGVAPLARIRLIPFDFPNPGPDSTGYSIFYDNVTFQMLTVPDGLLPPWNGVER